MFERDLILPEEEREAFKEPLEANLTTSTLKHVS